MKTYTTIRVSYFIPQVDIYLDVFIDEYVLSVNKFGVKMISN